MTTKEIEKAMRRSLHCNRSSLIRVVLHRVNYQSKSFSCDI